VSDGALLPRSDHRNIKEKKMKYKAILALMLVVPMALLVAAHKNSASVTFAETVTVNGTRVPPGNYRVEWQATGATVEASILQGKQVVASAPATLVNAKTNYDGAVETTEGPNNSKILQAIDWSNQSLRFDQANTSSPGTSAAGATD
jgi:hypothetical protein